MHEVLSINKVRESLHKVINTTCEFGTRKSIHIFGQDAVAYKVIYDIVCMYLFPWW